MQVLLDQEGKLHDVGGGILDMSSLPQHLRSSAEDLINDDSQHFFARPFSGIVRIENGARTERISAHPSTFYPGSPFDTFTAVRDFVRRGEILIPRMYLYPTSACNTRCPICQFNFRRGDPSSITWERIRGVLDAFAEKSEGMRAPSLVVSGDGEPTLHPAFPKMMNYAASLGLRIFLTSNWTLPESRREDVIESVAQNVAMLTISIKGLGKDAYNKYQGLQNGEMFSRVLSNIESLLERMTTKGKREGALLGIASLVLPENTRQYRPMLTWFADHGLDYVYLNVVEPSYERWGITFTPQEKSETLEVLGSLDSFAASGMLIRHSRNPFEVKSGNVYYDASSRQQLDICGSALWNPIVIPRDSDGVLLSCRNSDNFDKPDHHYVDTLDGFSFDTALSEKARARVMQATSQCTSCRLERQARTFDSLLTIERASGGNGGFMLEFDLENFDRQRKGGAVAFEDTFVSTREALAASSGVTECSERGESR